jgi:leucyl-tRNA synthetase
LKNTKQGLKLIQYNPSQIEQKWQNYWEKNNSFEPLDENCQKEKKYILNMFPYPSGKIHMGHVRNYCLGDAFARYYRKNDFNVLHPIGWDSFGMPAENAAIKNKLHPKIWTYENINYMKKELQSLGLSFSKTREFATSDELYTKWEQEFIIEMFEQGLLYQKNTTVNWCQTCHTVLANEQVEDGVCWRCENEVSQKQMAGYYIAITKYAQQLLDDLELLQGKWPSQVITMQKNWIGKSQGLEFDFHLCDDSKEKLHNNFEKYSVFTTRPDTIFGISYSALAPEHKIVKYLIKHKLLDNEKIKSINDMLNISEKHRAIQDKIGVDLEIFVLHPITKKKIPIFVANFVLASYGGGAVMAVPAHDIRDFEFATKYKLPIKVVIQNDTNMEQAYTGDGVLVNSEHFDGLKNQKAKKSILYHFEQNNLGKKQINFKLRDWGVSRQRYWGAPIPFVHCKTCGLVPQKKENLPITLPQDIKITGEGNPLDTHLTWKYCKCPKCGEDATKETDTLDTFIQSSWYHLRYATNPKKWNKEAISKDDSNYWMDVDHYIGGIEHAILHLLYARFFTKALNFLGYTNSKEPFSKLLTQGMVLKNGFKMSKSKGNVVNPSDIISKYGVDTARAFILFAAPPTKELEWNDNAVEGSFKFIRRFYDLSSNCAKTTIDDINKINHSNLTKDEKNARKKVYEALKKANEVMTKTYTFNTLIASCMEALNTLNLQKNTLVWSEGYYILTNILEPIVPHICWELATTLFDRENFNTILEIKKEVFILDVITMAITINGKKRAQIDVDPKSTKGEILALAKSQPNIIKWLKDKELTKEIVIPKKLVNFVIKG